MTASPKCGELWVAEVPFEENPNQSKIRPVLVVRPGAALVLSYKITSHSPRPGFVGEYVIQRWREAGLDHQSTCRLGQPIYLLAQKFKHKLGELHPADRKALQQYLR